MGKWLAKAITDKMATWAFIFLFLLFCGFWMLSNGMGWVKIDPMPFIFLNLMLSLMAAVQAPVILIDSRMADVKRDAILKAILEGNIKQDDALERILELEQRLIEIEQSKTN